MKNLFIYCLTFLLLGISCTPIAEPIPHSNLELKNAASTANNYVTLSQFEVMAYLPYWGYINDSLSTTNYDRYYYTDISTLFILATISKGSVLSNEGLIYGEGPATSNTVDFQAMINYIKTANPGLKIVLSLSDLHNTSTERAATAELVNNTNRSTTVNWLMANYVDQYDLDGIDIDFEDATLDSNYMGPYYSDFIKDLALALHDSSARGRRKICTATLSGGDYNRFVVTTDFINSIDMLGIQTYSVDKIDYVKYNSNRNMITHYTNWKGAGVPESKMAFGLPMWSKIADPSKSLGNQLPNSGPSNGPSWIGQLKQDPSSNSYRPYLTSSFYTPSFPGSYEQRYNGLYEVRRRAEWVKSKSGRGVFGWELHKDPNKNDPSLRKYSYLQKLMHWKTSPQNYLPIVGYTKEDYYGSNPSIEGGFHSLIADADNWVGCYEFDTTQPFNIGQSLGVYQYLPNQGSGSFTLPASWASQMTSNKMYILKFSNGPDGIGDTELGTSHPFYKL